MKQESVFPLTTLKSQDCYFFYNSSCIKGSHCPYRHEAAALGKEVICKFWVQGNCRKQNCQFRHVELRSMQPRKPTYCFWENQPSGCLRPTCSFLHMKEKQSQEPETGIDGIQDANWGMANERTDTLPDADRSSIEKTDTQNTLQKPKLTSSRYDALRKKHILEQQQYILHMKQMGQNGDPQQLMTRELDDQGGDGHGGLLSPNHWKIFGEVGSSGAGTPVSSSPSHVSPIQSFVLSIADDDSDSEWDCNPFETCTASQIPKVASVKSLDEIRLQKVQAEQESLLSYCSLPRPLPTQTRVTPPNDLRERILRHQQSKIARDFSPEEKPKISEVKIKTLEEIRAEKLAKEQSKAGEMSNVNVVKEESMLVRGRVGNKMELKRGSVTEDRDNEKRARGNGNGCEAEELRMEVTEESPKFRKVVLSEQNDALTSPEVLEFL